MNIGFQGVQGAYSELALLKYFSKPLSEVNPQGHDTSEEVLKALVNREITYGILPLENSIVGNVNVNLDLFYSEKIFIFGEVYIPIHHHLFVNKGSSLSSIKEVISHPIALDQCRNWILKNNFSAKSFYDTAGSCKYLAENPKATRGAIGSKLCGEYYDLEMISDEIQHVKNNFTRFLIFSRLDEKENVLNLETANKSSITFTTHHTPGSLLECLKLFNKYEINLSKLESRPIPEKPFFYRFFADFKGSIYEDHVKSCLADLKSHTQEIKILGTYEESKITEN